MNTQMQILTAASFSGDLEKVRSYAAQGGTIDGVDEVGQTALTAAIEGGRPAMVDLLLALGANPNAPSFGGWTPLHAAVDAILDGYVQGTSTPEDDAALMRITSRLLVAGADPNQPDERGRTAIAMLESSTVPVATTLLSLLRA